MGAYTFATLFILLNLGTFLTSLACPECPPRPSPYPTKPPPYIPKPPKVHPPHVPKPPPYVPVTPPYVPPTTPCPPPPHVPKPPPYVPPVVPVTPPYVPPTTPCPPPPCPHGCPTPKPPPKQPTCPIDTLKLEACVDVLGGLIHAILGDTKAACCPVLGDLVGLDAAICLCTTIKAKLLDINVVLPIALELLIDCGKTPPKGFQCPA